MANPNKGRLQAVINEAEAQDARRQEQIARQVAIIERLQARLAAHECLLGPQCPACSSAGIK